jgi:guanylate kinase
MRMKRMCKKGQLFVLSAPSGCGKDTMINELLGMNKNIRLSISYITRDMRPGEVQDGKYHFITSDEFEALLKDEQFLEFNIYNGNYYGTPKKPIEKWIESGYDVILEIDVNGAKKVTEQIPEAVSIFILPPSMEILRSRLMRRGTEDEQTITKRLKIACDEVLCADKYDYVIVNDDLTKAVNELNTVINAVHLRKDKMKKIIDEVQKDAKSFNRQTD